MSSTFGNNIKVSIFGQSHADAIGVNIDGLPAGLSIDVEELQAFLNRRAPGQNQYTTSRKEADRPEFLCGILDGVTTGSPLTAIIRNSNTKSKDYDQMRHNPRPGHADYVAHVKYGGHEDIRGGGHFSGRLTAPLCIAGGIMKQALSKQGITVEASILEIGGVPKDGPGGEQAMYDAIDAARKDGDSVGGVVECVVTGLPVGIGEPMFDGMENRIAQAIFAIPAVKGLEFGLGFEAARVRGSENNDAYRIKNGASQDNTLKTAVETETNHAGGILGGITNGMPIVFRVAFKPTPSIAKEQKSIEYDTLENVTMNVRGRHDPCIVPRAVPCVEAAAAIAIYDMMEE